MSSLRTRLLLAVGVMAVAAVAAVAWSARMSTRVEFQRFQDIERVLGGDEIRATLKRAAAALDGTCCPADVMSAASAALPEGQALLVLNATGAVLAASRFPVSASELRASVMGDVLKIETAHAGSERASTQVTNFSVSFKGNPSAAIALADGSAATVHVVPLPRDREQPAAEFLGSVDRRLVIATALVAALALVVTWVLARRIVGPITELRDAARALAKGRLDRRVSTRGADEVAELGRAFNAMAADLERQQGLRRNLLHDVAHELRTPLTGLQCRLETVIDGLAADPRPALLQMQEEVAHLSQLVSDLDELARAEAGEIALTIGDVRLAEICRSALRAAGLETDPRVRTNLDDAVVARADAVRVRQVVLNLLTNADRHAPAGGVITVRTTIRDGKAVAEVHNTGSALEPGEIDRVFDRFYRADPSRDRATGGRGLGLAIVKQLSEAQGGHAWATSDASGVTFGVALPPADSGPR
jgi:signal transduction histidine kinase